MTSTCRCGGRGRTALPPSATAAEHHLHGAVRPFPPALAAALKARGYTQAKDFNTDIAAIEIEGRRPSLAPDPRGRGVGRPFPDGDGRNDALRSG